VIIKRKRPCSKSNVPTAAKLQWYLSSLHRESQLTAHYASQSIDPLDPSTRQKHLVSTPIRLGPDEDKSPAEQPGRENALRHQNLPEGELLAFLCMKHEVNADQLFHALTSAKERQKIDYEDFSVECRGTSQLGRIFLIKAHSKVVAQLKISQNFLLAKNNPIAKFMDSERIRSYQAKKNASAFRQSVISDLRIGMKSINLNAKVLEIGDPSAVYTRNGMQGMVANALLGDKTGTVQLSLWGEQISSVSVGDTARIINAQIGMFKGKKQLRIPRNGALVVEHKESISV